MSKKVRILALSGGGARGIFQAQFLVNLDRHIRTKHNKKLWEYFDLFAGTSTGSIVAAALAMHIPPRDIVDLYDNNLGDIFRKSPFAVFRSGGRYSEDTLKGKLKDVWGRQCIKDAPGGLFITATSLDNYEGLYFTNRGHQALENISLVDAVLASTAAPTYFPAHKPESQERGFIDGGMWANAPALAAILFANKEMGYAFEDIQMFCVGTGKVPIGETLNEYNRRFAAHIGNVTNVLDILFTTQEQFSEAMSRSILDQQAILIINPTLNEKIPLDNFEKAQAILKPKADAEFGQHEQDITRFIEQGLGNGKKGIAPTNTTIGGIKKAGLTSFIPTRDDYKYFRKEGDSIVSYIMTAQKSLTMISVTLVTGVEYEDISKAINELINRGVTVKISLLNPFNQPLMEATAPLFHDMNSQELQGRIQKGLDNLVRLKTNLSAEGRERFYIYVHNVLPFGSAIMIDCEDSSLKKGRIQIETKPYNQSYKSSFAFEITDYDGNKLYENIYNGYKKLLADGSEWDPSP